MTKSFEIQDVAVHLFGHYILFAKYGTVGIMHMAPHHCYDGMSIKSKASEERDISFVCNPTF